MGKLSLWVFAFIASATLIYTSFLPTINQFRQTPPGHIFLGTHNNSLDYPMFVGAINRSQRGLWTNKAIFTSEPQPPDLVHWIYIPLGKITSLFQIDAIHTYQIGRLFFAFTLALSTFYFISEIFNLSATKLITRKSLLLVIGSFLLALFSAGFSKMVFEPKIDFTGPFLEWWSGGDVLRRATFQPHAMLKNTLLLLNLTWFAQIFKAKFPLKRYPLLLIAGLLLGLHDPMNSISIFLCLGIYLIAKFINTKFKFRLSQFLIPAIYIAVSSIGLYATYWAFSQTPWKVVSDWESHQYRPIPVLEYANHLGPIFYLGIPGLILMLVDSLRKGSSLDKFLTLSSTLLTFGSITTILLGLSRYVHLSLLRFFQTPVHIFLSIGTAYLLYQFSLIINRKVALISYLLLVALTLVITLPAYPLSLRAQKDEWPTAYWNFYPDQGSITTLKKLTEVSHPDDIVLSSILPGMVIPITSGNIVYVGHMVSTINFEAKIFRTDKFFQGKMTGPEASEFVRSTGAKYLVTIFPEGSNVNDQKYPFLQPIEKGTTLQLYKIDPNRY